MSDISLSTAMVPEPTAERAPMALPALLLLAVLAGLALLTWAASQRLRLVEPLSMAQRYELTELDTVEGRHRVLRSASNVALPAMEHADGGSRLRRARYEIDIGPYIQPSDLYAANVDGDPASPSRRPPAKGIVLPQSLNGTQVYLNGVWLAGFPPSTVEDRYLWFRPLHAELPRKLLRGDGPNVLTVELTSWEPYFNLPPVFIGDARHARDVQGLIEFLSHSLAQAAEVFCLLAGLFMLGVWLANPQDRMFCLLGCSALLWALAYASSLWGYMPAGWRPYWLWLFYLCSGALNVLLTLFTLSFIDRPLAPRMRLALIAGSAAACVLMPVLGEVAEVDLDRYWLGLLVPLQAWTMLQLARFVWRTGSGPGLMLLVVYLIAGLLILHDHNVMVGWFNWPRPEGWRGAFELLSLPIYLTHLALPPLLVVMARVHLGKYRFHVERVREANRILAETLRRREMELAVSYDRQRELESEAAAQDERDRIYRELHDGIGSRLVTTIFSVRDGSASHAQLEGSLLSVLQGVRDVVSSTDVREQRALQDILFDYCVNLDSLLSGPDFQVEYSLTDGHELVLLGDQSKDVLRIVEESAANTLKYADASRLRIDVKIDNETLHIEISDNGDSTRRRARDPLDTRPDFGTSTGNGLKHMQERANRLHAHFEFTKGPAGAHTTLIMPLLQPPKFASPPQ